MTTEATERDLITEVETLLNAPNAYAIRGEVRELLHRLVEEVKRQEERWNTRFNVLCGNCGKRYLGPRDEHLHGLGICGGSRDA